jgi:demethylmenaquinone methyltransferase / 2-methoxy-6-polyprenyl-1,4-benzoquinol methylase
LHRPLTRRPRDPSVAPMRTNRSPLQRMFAAVPRRYDAVNRLATFGLDQRWRKRAVAEILSFAPSRALDLCTGTGDLAVLLAEACPAETSIAAVDFSAPMLGEAVRKARSRGAPARIAFALADAATLPFPTAAFDVVCIGFGLRNLTWRNVRAGAHLAEILRVLRPGGRLVAAESSQPSAAAVRLGFRAYLRVVVGPLGRLVSGNRGAYAYLADSAARFYTDEELEGVLEEAGFCGVRHTPLLAGAAAIHVAEKPASFSERS